MYQNVPIELIERIEALERRMEKNENSIFFNDDDNEKDNQRLYDDVNVNVNDDTLLQ